METILRLSDVIKRTGLRKASIYGLRDFPKPIKLSDSGKAVGWLASEIDTWIESRIQFSRPNSQPTHGGQR